MIDIPEYEGLYKFDTELNQVFGIKKNKYLKTLLHKGSYNVSLSKNGKRKNYTIRNLGYMCNPIENINFVDIPNYEGLYKFDTELLQVYSLYNNMYLKNRLDKNGYNTVSITKNKIEKRYLIHRLIYICNNLTEDISDYQIDHIDNNKLNNKIENLRKATRSQNCSNTKTQKNNKSTGYKNIYKNKWNTYTFHLVKNGIRYQKNFKTFEEVIEYRNRVVLEKCGEFANLG